MSHDCVVIPGWGALIAQYSDSYHNPLAGRIERPRRKLGFNASVNHNDGLLAHSLMRREGIAYDSAVRFIEQSVSSFRQQLAGGSEVPLGRLGFFSSDNAGHIEFVPYYHEQSNDCYFGLRDVTLRPLEEQCVTLAEQHDKRIISFPRRYVRVAASIVALLGLTVLLTTPIIINRDHHDFAALNVPTVTMPQRQVIEWNDAEPAQAAATGAEQSVVQSDLSQGGLLLDEGGDFYLIVATLSSAKQADAYIQSHPDMASHMRVQMLSKNKLYRVYVAQSPDRQRLETLRQQLPSRYADAWVWH